MKIANLFILLFFSLGSLYNLAHIKTIQIKTYRPLSIKLIFIGSIFLFFWMAYTLQNNLTAYLLAALGSLFLMSGEYGKGISKDAIYTRSGKQLIVRVPFEKLSRVRLENKKNYFLLRANGRKMQIIERFDLEAKEEVTSYLHSYTKE